MTGQEKISEERMQIDLVNWFKRNYFGLAAKLHHSPNGGKRDIRTAQKMRLMGVQPGFVDLVLYHPSHGYNGLAMELKTPTGRLSSEQESWLLWLADCGFQCRIIKSLEEGQNIIKGYLDG